VSVRGTKASQSRPRCNRATLGLSAAAGERTPRTEVVAAGGGQRRPELTLGARIARQGPLADRTQPRGAGEGLRGA